MHTRVRVLAHTHYGVGALRRESVRYITLQGALLVNSSEREAERASQTKLKSPTPLPPSPNALPQEE